VRGEQRRKKESGSGQLEENEERYETRREDDETRKVEETVKKKTHDRSHTSVGLDPLSLVVEVLSRRLRRSGEESTHHDRAGSQTQGLCDVSDVSDSSVSPGRDSELLGELRDGVDGGSLRSTDGHDLLSDADRP